MRNFRSLKITSRGVVIFLAACFGFLLAASSARAVTPADADLAFDSLNKVYWDASAKYFRRDEQGTKKADFWFAAQLWDTVMDQYDRTHSAEVKKQIDDIYDGFVAKYPDWTRNKYNDDIMWWTIACTRAYAITQNERYLKKAKDSFDFIYDHFTDDTFGGGVYWINQKTSKNSCINSPTVIAAARLSVLLKEPTYLEKAKKVYEWQKKTLTDGTGKVFDSIGYNRGRPLMCLALQRLYTERAVKIGLASRIRQRPILVRPELRRRGGARTIALEEALTRREVRGRGRVRTT